MSNEITIGPKDWETPQLNNREIAVLKAVDLQSRHIFEDKMKRPSLYEIIWVDKKSKFTPKLSIIPISRSHGVNLNVLQRLFLKDFDYPIYILYRAMTPQDHNIIFTGTQAGIILDYPVDRGFFLKDKIVFRGPGYEAVPLVNLDDSEERVSLMNPLLALIESEIRNSGSWLDDKKSSLMGMYDRFSDNDETPPIGLSKYKGKAPKGFIITPYGNKTIIFASTCDCSSVFDKRLDKGRIKEAVELDGKRRTLTISPPGLGGINLTTQVVRTATNLTNQAKSERNVISKPPNKLGLNFRYLLLEAQRRQLGDTQGEISLHEILGQAPDSRIKMVFDSIDENLFRDYESE